MSEPIPIAPVSAPTDGRDGGQDGGEDGGGATGLHAAPGRFPRPGRRRFQPLRSGLVNLYRYDDQELWFEDGRLLLRGNNGTGKSRVLALQLPFLLDGEVAPHRMEPDGDSAKRVEWNLLLGGRYADRVGYTWLELGRQAPELAGGEEFVTLGCGLSAATGRGLVGRWFFVTPLRIGRDLHLVTAAGHPISRERLAEAVGRENVFTTVASYRDAVDRALFGLGKVRYDALVTLLVQLRQPQLSRQLDEERLSSALSEALSPPAPTMLADVAEAFRALDTDREALEGFRAASRAVEQFLAEYRRYAQIAARRRAAALRRRHSQYEETMRRLRDAERERAEAREAEGRFAEAIVDARVAEEAARATVETLASSPAMQDAQALGRARRTAEEALANAARAEADAERGRDLIIRRQGELDRAEGALEAAALRLAALGGGLKTAAAALGVERRHDEAVVSWSKDPRATLRGIGELLEERRRAGRQLRSLVEAFERARAAQALAEAEARRIFAEVDEAARAQQEAEAALARVASDLFEGYRRWARGLRLLTPPEPDMLVDAFGAWIEDPTGSSPLAVAIAGALAGALGRLATTRAAAEARLAAARARLSELREARDKLAAGVHRPPPPPATRDPLVRATLDGAPLWQVVDFSDATSPEQQAGLEGALEAAGILDAWVTPDGRLLGPGEHDVLLVTSAAPLPEDTAHLGTLLRPAIDRADARAARVSEEGIAAILSRIACSVGSADVAAAVDSEGRFRVGPLDGRFMKPAAEHIGEGARRAVRQRRLAELAASIAAVEAEEREATDALGRAEAEIEVAQAEAAGAPNDQPVRGAAAELEARGRALQFSRARLVGAERQVAERTEACATRTIERDRGAADLGLGAYASDLSALEEAIARYREEAAALPASFDQQRQTADAHDDASARAEEARVDQQRLEERRIELRGRAAALAAERDVLETSVGAAAQEILARHAEAQREARARRSAIDELGRRERAAHDRAVRADAEVARVTEALAGEEQERATAAAALVRFAGTRLLGVAVSALAGEAADGWSMTRTVEVARAIEAELEGVEPSDAAWERSGRGLFAHVQTLEQALLPQGHQASTLMNDDLVVVEMPFQGRMCTMSEFGEILAGEVTNRQMLLSAREREVLENHLVGEVSTHLHERLHAAEELVREMNEELAARPMSTGMTLRFSWKPLEDGPAGLAEARRRLMRAGATWTAAEREALGQFLGKRIEDVRAANQAGTWQDHLTEAFDYRRWHRFGVERLQDGVWKPLTRRTHGTGSGGEKAVALTLPQFAAAAAHYRSADAKAPRLILLDEAFVGIDSDMRAKCMGLLDTFELDFIMTSEREWGCYPTISALAIYQLATRPGIDAVGVTRFVWNGRERRRSDPRPPGARAPSSSEDAGAEP